MIRAAYGKPAQGMTYEQLPAPAAHRALRLLCLLVPTRNGETRSLPVHTLRPLPPRVCGADSHITNRPRRWNLEAPAFGMEGGAGLYLRETHATRPTAEVLERFVRLGQANALRPDSRTVRTGGVKPTAPAEAEQVQGRAPGSSDHASPIRRTEARAERTLDPARTETASARECGAASPPRAPEPSAARVG